MSPERIDRAIVESSSIMMIEELFRILGALCVYRVITDSITL